MITLLQEQRRPLWSRAVEYWRPTAHYCFQIEAHVYALAVAACVLLSFYPFIIVMLAICRNVLHSTAARDAILLALGDYFPGELGVFLQYNLGPKVLYVGRVPATSLLLLLVTANGIFVPLEVAFNRIWGVTVHRSYIKNQLVALGLIFLCGGLALLSIVLTSMRVNLLLFKLAAVPISILALFLVYWLLPNCKISARQVAPVAILVGLILEALKYVNVLVAPKLEREYGVFRHSVGILLWSFLAAMIVLAGAEWAARRQKAGCSPHLPLSSLTRPDIHEPI